MLWLEHVHKFFITKIKLCAVLAACAVEQVHLNCQTRTFDSNFWSPSLGFIMVISDFFVGLRMIVMHKNIPACMLVKVAGGVCVFS